MAGGKSCRVRPLELSCVAFTQSPTSLRHGAAEKKRITPGPESAVPAGDMKLAVERFDPNALDRSYFAATRRGLAVAGPRADGQRVPPFSPRDFRGDH